MSKDLNKVQLTGRLGKDPEVRVTPQGNTVTQFTVASNRSWKTADGQGRDDTEWFSIVAWNKLGEICGEYLRKGSRVYIEGRLQTRSWEDQESGQKRYKTEVIASDMIMLDSKRDMGGGDYGDADIAYGNEPEPEPVPARQAAPARSAPSRQPARAGSNGTTATQPRRPVAPPVDDDDLPF
ncbi:MAG TPA: single-stranded DNA-binding protein [Herpetosiphonaceae bacterium]